MKYYKLLTKGNKTLESWSAIVNVYEGGIRYYVNKWVKPRKGKLPLCVFASLKDAIHCLVPFWNTDIIYECEIKKHKKRITKERDFADKTVFADAVKLTRRVSRKELEEFL